MENSKEQSNQLLDHVLEAVWILNRDGSFAYANRLASGFFGFPLDELKKYKMFDFFSAENLHFFQQIYKRVFEGQEQQFDIPMIIADETQHVLHLRIIPFYQDHLIVGSMHYAMDITQQRATEKALDLSRERYQQLISDKTEFHLRLTPEGHAAFVNYEQIPELNQTREEILGKHFHELLPVENHSMIDQIIRSLTPENPSQTLQLHINFPFGSGEYMWTIQAIYSKHDDDSELIEYQVTGRNVTNRQPSPLSDQDRVKSMAVQTIRSLARTIEKKDPYTYGHQIRVADLAVEIAKEMNLTIDQIETVYYGSIIHDIGKIFIPSDILNRPGRLSDVEFTLIKTHPQIGYDILKEIELPWNIANMILEHHEHLDGTGYPNGLKAGDIMLESRILSVADVVESISSHRPYRPEKGIERSLREIEENQGTHYDAEVVGVCLKLFKEKAYDFTHFNTCILDPGMMI